MTTKKTTKLQPAKVSKGKITLKAEKKIATKTAKAVKAVAEAKSRAKTFQYTGKALEAGLSGVRGVIIRGAAELGTFTKAQLADYTGKHTKSVMDPMKNVNWYLKDAKSLGYVKDDAVNLQSAKTSKA